MIGDPSQTRLQYVKVSNYNDFSFTDRYDGVPIVITPNRSENLPQDMAAHFFGANFEDAEGMFRHVCKRQGWNTAAHMQPAEGKKKSVARDYFDKLKIEPVVYRLVKEEATDPHKPVPASTELPDETPRRKIGRPTNAEIEARNKASEAQ